MGKRGPSPTPTKILQNRGSWRGNIRPNEPRHEPLAKMPRVPKTLKMDGGRLWREVGNLLISAGILTALDLFLFEILCQKYDDYCFASALCDSLYIENSRGRTITNPALIVKRDSLAAVMKLAGEFGMSPSSRTGLDVNKVQPKNPFFDLLQKG